MCMIQVWSFRGNNANVLIHKRLLSNNDYAWPGDGEAAMISAKISDKGKMLSSLEAEVTGD